MRKIIVVITGIALLGFLTSCEKEQSPLDAAPVLTPTLSIEEGKEKVEPTFSEETLVHTEKVTFKEPESTSRSSTYGYNYQEVYSSSFNLHTGHWINIEMPKHQISRHYQYVAVVTPEHGDPDVYVRSHYYDHYGIKYSRTRRTSKRFGHYLDESWMNHRDFYQHESHGSFYIHASYQCRFKVIVYQVPINTIWIRHSSSHYGQKNIRMQYNGIEYGLQPRSCVALPYNYTSPKFRIYQCVTRNYPYRHRVCGWKTVGENTSSENFMYTLSDSNGNGQEQGGLGFSVTRGN